MDTFSLNSLIAALADISEMKQDIAAIKTKIFNTHNDHQTEYLTVNNLIDYIEKRTGIRYDTQTIYDKVNKHEIPCKKRKKPLLFEKASIDLYIDGGMTYDCSNIKLKI